MGEEEIYIYYRVATIRARSFNAQKYSKLSSLQWLESGLGPRNEWPTIFIGGERRPLGFFFTLLSLAFRARVEGWAWFKDV